MEGQGEGGGLSKSPLAPSGRSEPGAAAPRGSGDGTAPLKLRIAYEPGHSFLHRLHPLVKLAWLLAGTVFVFIAHSPWAVVGVVAWALLAHRLSHLHLSRRRGVRLFATMAVFLAALQLAFVRQGPVLFRLGPFAPTTGGLEAAIYVPGRFLSVILLSYLFVLTTDPSDLAYALVRAGVPYRFGFALVTALRLVPVFEQEAQTVYNAQLARGVRYDVRSPRRLLTLARQFFLPLLVSALDKADTLAISMEGRCFGKYPSRTYLRQAKLGRADALALALLPGVLIVGAALGSTL